MGPAGQAAAALPGGHVEGFFDTFCAHFRAVYADVVAGRSSSRPDLSHVRRRPRRDARRRRHRRERPDGRWVDVARARPDPRRDRWRVPHDEARLPDRPVPRDAADGRRRLGRRERLRGARDRLLAARRPARPAATPARRHIDVANLSAGAGRASSRARSRPRACTSPASATTRTRSTRTRPTATTVIGHLKHVIDAAEKMDVPLVNTFMGGDGGQEPGRELGARRSRSGRTSSRSPQRPRPQAHHRELPDAVQLRRVAGRAQHRDDRRGSGAGSWSSGAARSGSTSTRRT